MEIFLRNLAALGYTFRGAAFQFSIDATVQSTAKLISYDSTNMIDALTKMAETWECEWWVTDNIIHFGRCEFGDPIDFEIDVNVKSMSRSDSQTNYATRIIAFGSTRNIPLNYRPIDESLVVNGVVQKRLMLPVGTPCVDAYENMTQEEAVEDIVVFDDVYPRRTGTMSDITTKEYTDTIENKDGTKTTEKWNAYRFKDTGVTFSKDYIIAGEELKINIESGLLNGMEFGVTFNPDGKAEKLSDGSWNPEAQLWEIVRNDSYGRNLPDSVLIPKNGDTYILSGFDTSLVSDQYLPAAERELKEKTEAYVAKTKIDPSTYDNKMDSDYMYNNGNQRIFEIGDRVNLINEGYFKDGRISRIIGFEYNLDKPYDSPTFTVGETAAYSRIGEIENKVDAVTYKGQNYTGTGGSGVYVIRLNDSTTASNSNVYSALRALAMFLRKDAPDQAAEIIDFLKGLTVNGDKASIDKDGNATVQQLIALVKAQIAALEVTGNTKTNSLDVTETATAKDVEVSNSVTTLNAVIQALAKTHDLTVENTADIMNGIIRQYLTSESFVSGFLGSGFKIWKDEQGLWHGEFDELTVRKTFLVFELVVQKIVHQGGMVIRSAAGGKLKKVTDGGAYWKCEHDSTDDFVVGDQVLCQTFTGMSMKRYWRLVTSAGAGYFNLSKSDCETGSANPEAGDEVAVLGNRTVTARQKAQIDCAVGDDAPYRDDYSGINSYSLVRKLVCRSGNCSGIVDEVFGALDETVNFYGKGVRLRGSFALESSGKLVEDEISGQISNVRTELEVTAGQISSKVTEATTAAKNADSSATLAQGYASTAGQKAADAAGSASEAANILTTVTQKETSINQTAQAIELKAVRAESAAVRAESAEASINLKADGIVLQASNQAAKAAVDGVQVGGSNLIRNGSKFTSTAYWELYNTTGVTIEYSIWNNVWSGYVPALTIHLDSFTSGEVGIYQDIATEIGQQYAFSCYIAGHRSSKVISIQAVGSNEITRWDAGFILGGNSIADWQKPELIFTATTTTTRIYIFIPYYTDKDEYIWLKDIVCVKGNKVTGWTPAPEDVGQDATDKATAVKTYTEQNFASLTVMNDAISGLASKTVTNGLESRLTSAEAKITPDQINLTVKSQTQSLIANNAEQSITQTLDLTGLDNNTYYPVTVYVDPYITSVIQVKRGLYGMQNADSYATHSAGFALLARWSTNGSGWGAIEVRRTFYNAEVRFVNAWPIGNIGQNNMASYEHFYLRGGSTYDITLIGKGISNLWLHTSEYRWGDDTYNYTLPLLSSLSNTPEVTYKTVAEIQAGINIVAGGISVFGQELSFAGKVTFSSLASDAQNKINAAQSTADTANSTASSALASAGTANSGLTTLRNSLGSLAYANTVSLAKLDTTIIEGGYIKTALINANAIITNELLATKIAATDITTRRLKVGEGCTVGDFSIGSGRIGISTSPDGIGDSGMFLYADMIGFNSTITLSGGQRSSRQAIVGTYSVLGYPRLGQFIDTTSNYMPNVGLVFDINSTNNGGRNYAFVGRGNGVLNGFMCGYAFQELSFTKANQWQEISKLTSVVGIYGNYNNWAVVLPTFASVCNALNIGYNTPFVFQITVLCTSAVDSGKLYGRSNSGISGISGYEYPELHDWNNGIDNGGYVMGAGDSFQIVLFGQNNGTSSIPVASGSYRAYIVNKLS